MENSWIALNELNLFGVESSTQLLVRQLHNIADVHTLQYLFEPMKLSAVSQSSIIARGFHYSCTCAWFLFLFYNHRI